ncbi:MAG TPA: hypothetical protein VJ810_28185 [Blastocatellia bacterium]|nr:hypothetical protein [Blastocatellia bacterium]
MSKRLTNREKLLSKLNNFSENEIGELLKFVASLEKGGHGESSSESGAQTSTYTEDDLLMLLSAARENRRARQVFEWESVRRRVEGKASINRYR